MTPVCWSADRHGFVVVEGASAAEVDAALAAIQDRLVFEVSPRDAVDHTQA
ncbi:hypothetical protein ACFWN1_32210 [Streptomyces sp. NPDC058459]|uniref:hypothetical protein n=1 Tax=Streptomyces sp. NPDC058459 TaxID=3346508 RepID=UPI0036499240